MIFCPDESNLFSELRCTSCLNGRPSFFVYGNKGRFSSDSAHFMPDIGNIIVERYDEQHRKKAFMPYANSDLSPL